MWSLFKRNEENQGTIGEFDLSGEMLEPLKFSNGKTQADVVKEALDAIESGNRVIFIHGRCGTGKSAIALNIARNFEKSSIVVPIKSLQDQYEKDYAGKKFILKDKRKLKISIIKGRNNFKCPFSGERADSMELPCTVELRERNMEIIKKYIEMNPAVSKFDFSSVEDVRRMSIAPACPYWSPILPAEAHIKLEKAEKKKYPAVFGKDYVIYSRKKGCQYYDQYKSYCDSDVLIFNSLKYILETAIGRKPRTDIDIIDECDEFLDSFAQEKKINLTRLLAALHSLPAHGENREILRELIFELNNVLIDTPREIEKISSLSLMNLAEKIISNPYLAEDEEDNYYNKAFEIFKEFEPLFDETYVNFEKEGEKRSLFQQKTEQVYATLVTINLAKRFSELLNSAKVLVLMSGTLHSERVLRDIFGLKDFKVIEAETEHPGMIIKYRTGLEKNCKYENFRNGIVNRRDYLKALSCCVENASKPVLVHISAFDDLPNELEKAEFKAGNLISREKFALQNDAELVEKFRKKEIDTLFTTKCSRGVDFPGEQCNSIIITKYPYPNIQGLFWKILRKEQPEKYLEFYLDKAKRDLLQKIYRGVRFKEDHVLLLSPDSRVLDGDFK